MTSLVETEKKFSQGDKVALKFFAICGFYLVALALVGVILGIKQMSPDFLSFLRPDVLRPVHLQLIIFGWLSMALMGAFYYIIPREVDNELASPALGNLHFILMQVGIVGVGITLFMGYSSGREYLEPILLMDIAVVLVWVVFVANMFLTIFKSKLKVSSLAAKPALSFLMISSLYLGVNYLIGMLPLSGMRDVTAIWTFAHNEVNGWFMFGLMGVMYFIIPRLTGTLGNEPYNKKLSYIHFWSLMLFIPPSALHHMLYDSLPVSMFWKIAGEWTSVGMLLPTAIWVYIISVSFKNSKNPVGVAGKFFIAAMIFYALNCVQGSIQSIRVINTFVHGTQWVVGHAHLALVGWISFGVFGLAYYIVPKITGKPIFSERVGNLQLWVAVTGFLGMFLSLTIAGLIQGSMFSEGISFYTARLSIGSYIFARAFFGVLFTVASAMFAWNIYRSITSDATALETPKSFSTKA